MYSNFFLILLPTPSWIHAASEPNLLKMRLKQSVIERKARVSGPAGLRRHERLLQAQRRQQKQNSTITSEYWKGTEIELRFRTFIHTYPYMYSSKDKKRTTEEKKRVNTNIYIFKIPKKKVWYKYFFLNILLNLFSNFFLFFVVIF